MTISVYVMGASDEIERAEHLIAALRERGYRIEFDWPAGVRSAGSANVGITADAARVARGQCIRAASQADLGVLLVPNRAHTIGAWAELGAAHAHRVPVLLITHEHARPTIMTTGLPEVGSTDLALVWIAGFAAGKA